VPRPGGLLGQGTRAVFFLLLSIAAVQVVIWLAFALQGPTTGRGALDPPGAGATLRPALGGRPPRRRRLDRAVSPLPPNSCLSFSQSSLFQSIACGNMTRISNRNVRYLAVKKVTTPSTSTCCRSNSGAMERELALIIN
jgi:hypothetical protein